MKVSDFAYLVCKCETRRGCNCIYCCRLLELDNSHNRECKLSEEISEHKGIYLDYIRAEYETADDRRKEVQNEQKARNERVSG